MADVISIMSFKGVKERTKSVLGSKIVKVCAYIGAAVLLAVLTSSEFQDRLRDNVKLALWVPLINVALVAFVQVLNKVLGKEDSKPRASTSKADIVSI